MIYVCSIIIMNGFCLKHVNNFSYAQTYNTIYPVVLITKYQVPWKKTSDIFYLIFVHEQFLSVLFLFRRTQFSSLENTPSGTFERFMSESNWMVSLYLAMNFDAISMGKIKKNLNSWKGIIIRKNRVVKNHHKNLYIYIFGKWSSLSYFYAFSLRMLRCC